MARINLEDSIYRDSRFLKLVIYLGCEYKALGLLVSAWSLAQKYYLNKETNRLIEKSAWLTNDYLPLLTIGLAEERDTGFYIKGSNENFTWLIQKQNAGKLGGRPKKTESGTLSGESGTLSGESGPNPLTPTLYSALPFFPKENIKIADVADNYVSDENNVVQDLSTVYQQHNSTKIFHEEFGNQELQKIKDFLRERGFVGLIRLKSKIFRFYKTFDNFASDLENILESGYKKFSKEYQNAGQIFNPELNPADKNTLKKYAMGTISNLLKEET